MIRRFLATVMAAATLTLGLVALSPAPAMAAGGWRIDSKPSGRCITPSGNNTTDRNIGVVLSNAPCKMTWTIEDIPGSDLKYLKLDANANRCLVPSGSDLGPIRVVTGACFDLPVFKWRAIPVDLPDSDRQWVQWSNEASWLCLTVDDPIMPAGTPLSQAACDWPTKETQMFASSPWTS